MWFEVIKIQTTGLKAPSIKIKTPKDEKCCEDAKDELLKSYPVSIDIREEIKNYTCEEFREELKESIIEQDSYDDTRMYYLEKHWGDTLKEILETWDECENVKIKTPKEAPT
jgi:hypothetical protein